MTPKLNFIIDKYYDLQMIPPMLKTGKHLVELPAETINKIQKDGILTHKGEVENYLDNKYKLLGTYLEKTKNWYQSWLQPPLQAVHHGQVKHPGVTY